MGKDRCSAGILFAAVKRMGLQRAFFSDPLFDLGLESRGRQVFVLP
jgi:hypothetical protein